MIFILKAPRHLFNNLWTVPGNYAYVSLTIIDLSVECRLKPRSFSTTADLKKKCGYKKHGPVEGLCISQLLICYIVCHLISFKDAVETCVFMYIEIHFALCLITFVSFL